MFNKCHNELKQYNRIYFNRKYTAAVENILAIFDKMLDRDAKKCYLFEEIENDFELINLLLP